MLATVHSATLFGLEGFAVRVEVEAQRNIPAFELVGLAEAAVRESRVRVKSALTQVGVDVSECRIVVNLAPADLRKSGSGFDLAIAIGVMAALGRIEASALDATLILGELSLTGVVHPLRGVVPHLLAARARGLRRAIVPRANEAEAALVPHIEALTVLSLGELVDALQNRGTLPVAKASRDHETTGCLEDLSDVRGQTVARRALEICAAGGHNLLMVGPPGSGKTMLARRLPTILPRLTEEERLEVFAIHSVAGLLGRARLGARPFRSPHHTTSDVALVGGSDALKPGEISLAHRGVLFLDELPEFRRSALEALRQPLEDGCVTVARATGHAVFPAKPLFVGAMNPCACGHLGDGTPRCVCLPERVRAYRARVSGPLVDRIDVHVVLPPVRVSSLQKGPPGESSSDVRDRVARARAVQADRRCAGVVRAITNATLSTKECEAVVRLCPEGASLLGRAFSQFALSARAYGKVLRVARTIADLDGRDEVKPAHVLEAISFRVLDRGGTEPAATADLSA